MHAGRGASGDNIIIVRTAARGARAPDTVVNGFAAVLDLRDAKGHVRQIVSDGSWTVRSSPATPWQPARVVAPLADLRVNVGSDRQELESAPDRITTGVSLVRKIFSVQGPVRSARLYITAMGSYRAFLNGQRVGASELAPGFTDFRKRVLYQTYDVTKQVQGGQNALGVKLVADGTGARCCGLG